MQALDHKKVGTRQLCQVSRLVAILELPGLRCLAVRIEEEAPQGRAVLDARYVRDGLAEGIEAEAPSRRRALLMPACEGRAPRTVLRSGWRRLR